MLVLLFQFSGVFFILFYYPEITAITIDHFVTFSDLPNYIQTGINWSYKNTNQLQDLLYGHYHYIVFAAVASLSITYLFIALTTLRRGKFRVFIRAIFFSFIGLMAIPTVLLLYQLRWVPGAILSTLASIRDAIASFFSVIAPYVGYAIAGLITLSLAAWMAYLLFTAKARLRIAILLGFGLCLLWFTVPEFSNLLSIAFTNSYEFLSAIAAYPIAGLGHVFGFLGAAIVFFFGAALTILVGMVIISQFGHMLVDSLFDARNVQRSALAAGRFLVGIGFLVSTVLLCLPENKTALAGTGNAISLFNDIFALSMNEQVARDIAAQLGSLYLWFIPDAVEPQVVQAFSYGYPPSLELILTTIACIGASLIMLFQLFRKESGQNLQLAFVPYELLWLLIGAALVLVFSLVESRE